MSTITAEKLFENYRNEFENIAENVKENHTKAIPYVIKTVTTDIVPSMAQDLGKIEGLSGSEKKQLIVDATELAIKEVFQELNQIPALAKASWDEDLRDILLSLIGPLLDKLVSVEQGKLVFNKRGLLSKILGACAK